MTNKLRFLFYKGVIDTILYLNKTGKAGYYKIYKQGYVVSRQTFANILKMLEKQSIVERKIIDVRPPRVEYSLTDKGKETAKELMKLINILTK